MIYDFYKNMGSLKKFKQHKEVQKRKQIQYTILNMTL